MASPGRECSQPGLSFVSPTAKIRRWGLWYSAKGPVSRILSCAVIPLDAALPRTFISDLPGGFGNSQSRLNASGRCAAPPDSSRALPSLFGLAPCGVYLDPDPYGPSGALLPHHFTLTPALEFSATASEPGKPGQLGYCVSREALQPDPKNRGGVAEAVSFLWHWPSMGFDAHVPDVIRHTALRSSDFPPPVGSSLRQSLPAATARSSCQGLVYRSCGSTS